MYEVVVGSELRGLMTSMVKRTPRKNSGKDGVNWVLVDDREC